MLASSHATNYIFMLCWHSRRNYLSLSSFHLHALSFSPMHIHCTSTSKLKQVCRYMKIPPICVCTRRLHKSIQTLLTGSTPDPIYVEIVIQSPTETHVQPLFSTCTPLSSRSFFTCAQNLFVTSFLLSWLIYPQMTFLNKEVQVLSDEVSARLKVVG